MKIRKKYLGHSETSHSFKDILERAANHDGLEYSIRVDVKYRKIENQNYVSIFIAMDW